MTRVEKLKLWLPVFVWVGVIFTFSSLPINHETTFSWWDFILKKTAHVVEYGILYWFVWRALSQKGQLLNNKILIWSLVLCLVYAISDEWHQTIVAGREGTLRDVGFDTIGMLLSWTQVKKNL